MFTLPTVHPFQKAFSTYMMLSLGCRLGLSPCLAMLLLYNRGVASVPARKLFLTLHRKWEEDWRC